MEDVNGRVKTTVREELEYWNVLYVLRRLNWYYRNRLRGKLNKDLQGLESNDFSMCVLEKVISEDVSWQRSNKSSFIDFVYDVAKGELSHFNRANRERSFIDFDETMDNIESYRIQDHYMGF